MLDPAVAFFLVAADIRHPRPALPLGQPFLFLITNFNLHQRSWRATRLWREKVLAGIVLRVSYSCAAWCHYSSKSSYFLFLCMANAMPQFAQIITGTVVPVSVQYPRYGIGTDTATWATVLYLT